MDTNAILEQMRTKRAEIGQRYADAPKTAADLRASLFGEDKTLSSLRENEAAKIKELYEHDKAIASNYVPQTPGFIEDPGAKARFGSEVLARQGGELADIQKGIANRRDVLGDALTKGMEIFTAGLDAMKWEYGGMRDERDFLLQLQELAEKRADRADQKRSTSIIEIGGRKVLVDAQTGETIKDLGSSGVSTPLDDIDSYAASYLDGDILPSEIPAEIRGKVLQRAAEFKKQAEVEKPTTPSSPTQPQYTYQGKGLLQDLLELANKGR